MTHNSRCLVVTTINEPNSILQTLAAGAIDSQMQFFIAGDTKTPDGFAIKGANYLSVQDQEERFPQFCSILPTKHYSRKNVAYLAAMAAGCEWIQETDDDNLPLDGFWLNPPTEISVEVLSQFTGWVNAYAPFSNGTIWPRGFPLDLIRSNGAISSSGFTSTKGRIRQGLANANPDVDAIYRLVLPLPFDFCERQAVMPAPGQWCPFNSQNTLFHRDVFALLYLPSYCSFRMTDIWRSFIAQRCLWEHDENVVFHSATVVQERNEHDLMRDFKDEVPGYLENRRICEALASLNLRNLPFSVAILECYKCMVDGGWLPEKEIHLLEAWLDACKSATES